MTIPPPGARIFKRQRTVPAFISVLAATENRSPQPWTFKEKFISRYHGYARWITRTTWKVSSGLHLARIPTPDEVVRQSRILVRDYIYARLKKQGLLNHRRVDLEPSCKPSDVSYEIQYVGAELERMYPDLYKNVSRQLNVTMSSESIVRKTFTAVGEEILKDGRDNFTEATVTWGKVVALFATANAFAVDCVQQGHPEFVALVVDSFENLVSKNLVDWIVKQGGWPDIIRTFRTSRDATFLWALSGLGAVVGFILTLAATIHL